MSEQNGRTWLMFNIEIVFPCKQLHISILMPLSYQGLGNDQTFLAFPPKWVMTSGAG